VFTNCLVPSRFHPPAPSYEIKKDEKAGTYSVTFAEEAYNKKPLKNLSVYVIKTSTNTSIPIFCFRSRGAKLTLIYSHGNATDIGLMFSMYAYMASELGINVVAYDYTGYGSSMADNIRPTEKQTYKDIEAVYNWCVETNLASFPSSQIILYGQSVGSGPSCYLASTRPCAGLILHSGILSGIRVLTASRMLFCFDIFPNIDRIQRVRCPVFVIHGMEDKQVGFHHGLNLFNAVPEEFRTANWWVPDRGHNNVIQGNEREFFE
jgi:pimeloyl-ACP methyl ester carboxylesterase